MGYSVVIRGLVMDVERRGVDELKVVIPEVNRELFGLPERAVAFVVLGIILVTLHQQENGRAEIPHDPSTPTEYLHP